MASPNPDISLHYSVQTNKMRLIDFTKFHSETLMQGYLESKNDGV